MFPKMRKNHVRTHSGVKCGNVSMKGGGGGGAGEVGGWSRTSSTLVVPRVKEVHGE